MVQKYSDFDNRMETEYHFKNGASLKSQMNRGNLLRKVCFALLTAGIIFGGGNNTIEAQIVVKNDSIKPYIHFLENNKFLSAKEYVLSKFETHDIVILSERFHQDMSQYDVIMDVVKDERFNGHIYTEIGHVNLYEKFNKFLLNSSLTKEEKEREMLDIYRDLCPSFIWGPYNYYHMLSEVWELNKNRKPEDKILIFPTDIQFDYNEIQTHRERNIHYLSIFNGGYRDQMMGMNFIDFYEKAKKEKPKALVILNSMHGYKKYPTWLALPTRPLIRCAGEFINKTYPEKVFNIYINCCNIDNTKLSNNGIIDAAFEYTKKDNVGFDLKNTPIGDTKFDLYFTYAFAAGNYDSNINYDYIFDGMIFYKSLREMVIKIGIPNIYSKENEDLFLKRLALTVNMTLENDKEDIDKLLKDINGWPVIMPLDEYLDSGTVETWEKQIKQWIE